MNYRKYIKTRKRSLSQDRHGESSSRNGPIRAKSERDLSRVAKVKGTPLNIDIYYLHTLLKCIFEPFIECT